jgi:NADH-quinone oxidoreductase subunit M
MASAGLPGLNNFVGEFLVLAGSFRVAPLAAVAAFAGVVLSLVYTVLLVQKLLFQGEREVKSISELTLQETLLLSALAGGVLLLGIHPMPFLELIRTPVAILTGGLP